MSDYSSKAILSIIFGILSILLLWIIVISIPLAIFGVMLGYLAIRDIKKSRNRMDGKELAIVGLITGLFSMLIFVFLFWLEIF